MKNKMKLEFSANPVNEGFARVAVAAFITEADPTIEEMEDIKTAVSEAVTNSIIHGYAMDAKCFDETKQTAQSENSRQINQTVQSESDKQTNRAEQIKEEKNVTILGEMENGRLHIEVIDYGVGIEDISKAMEPFFTSKPKEERSGMGFSFMDAFMDSLQVISSPGQGTKIIMEKQIGKVEGV